MLLLNTADLVCSFSKITCEFIDVIEDLFNSKNFCVYQHPWILRRTEKLSLTWMMSPDLILKSSLVWNLFLITCQSTLKYFLTSSLVSSEPTVYLNNYKFLRVALRSAIGYKILSLKFFTARWKYFSFRNKMFIFLLQ